MPGTPVRPLPAGTGESVSLWGERRDSGVVSVGEDSQGSSVRGGEDSVTPTLVRMVGSVTMTRRQGWAVSVNRAGEEHFAGRN